jgi:hypothetical protein
MGRKQAGMAGLSYTDGKELHITKKIREKFNL